MDNLNSKTIEMSNAIQRINGGINEYLLISSFGKSKVPTDDPTAKPFFRIFTPVKPEKNRKLNSVYGGDFNIFNDSLLDYPTIIRYKLGRYEEDWRKFNRLIAIHIPECPLNCWHCYLEECLKNSCQYCGRIPNCDRTRRETLEIKTDWFSAKKIVDSFLEQRDIDASHNLESNVLRITGGEPLLIPNFILEILKELKSRGLDKEIFVWTETNLIPLIAKIGDFYVISDEILEELVNFSNFCIHPCFHGLNESEFQVITGASLKRYDLLFDALRRLLKNGIDVYPTFGSNVSNKDSIELFYERISQIDSSLPLRFALIEYSFNYPAVIERMEYYSSLGISKPGTYDKNQSIEVWNRLLNKHFKKNYTDLPRHLIPYSNDNDLIHLFKWPSKIEFQQKLMEIISLPVGSRCEVQYDEIWVNDYFEIKYSDLSKLKDKEAIFWILCCKQDQSDGESLTTNFVFTNPLRKILIKNVSKKDGRYYFEIIVLDYFQSRAKKTLAELTSFTKIPFKEATIPYPGLKKGFIFLGKNIDLSDNPFSNDINLSETYKILSEIPALNSVNVKISDYPLVKIDTIQITSPTYWEKTRAKIFAQFNKSGHLEMTSGKKYNINFTFFQGDDEIKRVRQISIDSHIYTGKSGRENIQLIPDNIDKRRLNVITEKFSYNIELPIDVITPWYKKKIYQYVVLIAISVFLLLIGLYVFKLDTLSLVTAVIPIIVIFIDKLWK